MERGGHMLYRIRYTALNINKSIWGKHTYLDGACNHSQANAHKSLLTRVDILNRQELGSWAAALPNAPERPLKIHVNL